MVRENWRKCHCYLPENIRKKKRSNYLRAFKWIRGCVWMQSCVCWDPWAPYKSVCVCVCATWDFGKPNKSRCSPTVIRACEIVPLKMLWSECVCAVCVVRLCCLCLEYLETRRRPHDSLALVHSVLRFVFFPPLPACVFFWSHTSVFLPRCAAVKSGQIYL